MDANGVLKQLGEKGFLISPDALKAISDSANPEELAKIALQNVGERLIIEPADFNVIEKTKILPETVVVQKTLFKPMAKEYEARVRLPLKKDWGSTGSIDDFVKNFRNRYEQMSAIFHERSGSITNIDALDKRRGEKTKIVAIVTDRKLTKNGHFLLHLEDLTGTATALIPASNKPLINQAQSIVLDDVMCVDGVLNRDLFIVENFQHPDLPIKEVKTVGEDLAIVMTSDLHVGNKLFMRHNFEHFLAWLRGESNDEKERALAGKIKYLTISGDCVDGIGVYPNQESELEITDIYEQYKDFEKLILDIPEYIHVVIAPGNHDAVKTADPQPPLPAELFTELTKLKNISFVGSPATVEMHGLNILMYHGTASDPLIAAMPGLNYEETVKVQVEMLRKRHLHPIYGEKPITPCAEDALVINEIPDLFQAGHLHRNGYDKYRGVICINSGTWQQVTSYQLKQGHKPTPCVVPCVEIKQGKISVVRFDRVS